MKRCGDQMIQRLSTSLTMVLLALTFLGCNDLTVAELEAQRQEVGFFIEQELQRSRNAARMTAGTTSLPPAQPVWPSAAVLGTAVQLIIPRQSLMGPR